MAPCTLCKIFQLSRSVNTKKGTVTKIILCIVCTLFFAAIFERPHLGWRFNLAQREEPGIGYVCGKFGGSVFEFPKSYVFLSPEYEGYSVWEQGYEKNKRGCDANFTVVGLKVEWPSLSPAPRMWVGRDRPAGHMGLTLEKRAVITGRDAGLSFEHLVSGSGIDLVRDKRFNAALGLYELSGISRVLTGDKFDIYWSERRGYIDVLVVCAYMSDEVVSDCRQTWLMSRGGVLVRVNYTVDYLEEWQGIMGRLDRMILNFKRS